MKWWLKCISMTIIKTASRNVAFKANRMSERIMESQDEFVTRKYEGEETEVESERQAAFDDIGFNFNFLNARGLLLLYRSIFIYSFYYKASYVLILYHIYSDLQRVDIALKW